MPNQVLIAATKEPTPKKSHADHSITFDDSDLEGLNTPHQDPLVISARIGDPCYKVKRILIDNGSSVYVLFYSIFLNMGLTRKKLQPAVGPLYGFDNRPIRVEGKINLPVVLGEFPQQATHSIQFIVVKSESAYNAIFRRPLQSIFSIVASIPHFKLKFLTQSGTGIWGIDILGPFPIATGKRKFIILAVDYFTKWVEAEPLVKITEANSKQFLWKNIICRFGNPAKVVTDNGTQFTGRVFTIFCKDLHIQLVHTAVAHPQTNGQTEVTNQTILRGLKTRLDKAGGQWADELPNVLWAYCTTARTPTGETPYNLCFGMEAIIFVDIGVPSHRVQTFDFNANDGKLRHNLDLHP
ncbi:uncharacterized protein LOC110094864 [Dendrobium catenatum]|uniref:uncharacterized protein LOC110094864 n=1 Tax=Dendrobium catenatum TaxID=906689 RepID=UPI0009F28D89|nr:uncharacterized protein LOC110094864 [Dendrobium catenatum]